MTIAKIISYMGNVSSLPRFLITVPAIIIALVLHNLAHKRAARKVKSIAIKRFAAKNPESFSHANENGGEGAEVQNIQISRKGIILSALAGPAANFATAFLSLLLFYIIAALIEFIPLERELSDFICIFLAYVLLFFQISASLNVSFGIINLIPLPPLDGAAMLLAFLPIKYYFGVMKYRFHISIALLVLLFTGALDVPLSLLYNLVLRAMDFVINLIPFI